MNPTVNWFFKKATKWQEEYSALRLIVLDCGLSEELKWGCPCYTFQKSNVVLIHGFKDYCALLFMKGVLIEDTKGILIQQTENVQAARQIRFRTVQEILKLKSTLKTYIKEAINIQKKGLQVELKKASDYKIPEEFNNVLGDMPELKTAFQALSPGRQKSYIFYFSSAKLSKTREARIEKFIPKILIGKGLED